MSVRLFIGNLPYDVRAAELQEHFAAAGELTQIMIPIDPTSGRPRGFAFVDLGDQVHADEAIRRFDGQPFRGRTLAISVARPRESRAPSAATPPGGVALGRPADAPARAQRTERTFGPDAAKRGRGPGNRRHKTERAPKGPLRALAGGRVFGIDIDDDGPDNNPDLDDNVATRAADLLSVDFEEDNQE